MKSYMEHDKSLAVEWTHITKANAELAADPYSKSPAFKKDPMLLWRTELLFTGEVIVVTNLFNGKRPSELSLSNAREVEDEVGALPRTRGGLEASRFCRIMSFDQLIFNIAQDVRASLAGSPVGKKFVITNNCYIHVRPGVHWVAVVYEIKAEDASQECASPEPLFGYGPPRF